MHFVDVKIWIDEPEIADALGGPDEAKRTFECEFDYEPADPSVGIPHESFGLYRVTDSVTQEEYYQGDLPRTLWDRVEEQMREAAIEERETARTEAAIERMEWNQNFPL